MVDYLPRITTKTSEAGRTTLQVTARAQFEPGISSFYLTAMLGNQDKEHTLMWAPNEGQ
jgi:hypothetical protein